MLPPITILHDPTSLLADVRMLLSPSPELADYPEYLSEVLGADERDVRSVLEVLNALDAEVLG
jgi:hypothetical protein